MKRYGKVFLVLALCLCLTLALAACGGKDSGSSNDSFLGEEVSTDFFDFSIDSAEVCSSYNDLTASSGNHLVVVEMSIKNTSTYSMPMFDNDFQIQWGSGDEDYAFPVAGSLCADYEIPINDTATGDLVFEVPSDTKDYSIAFEEYYEDNTTGETYFIYFTVTEADGKLTA